MIGAQSGAASGLDGLYAELARLRLDGVWRLGAEIQAAGPLKIAQPYVWRGADIQRVQALAGELVQDSVPGEQRTVRLVNPGLVAQHCATQTLSAAVQLLGPGEIAPAHRHSPVAIRFVISGQGAYTTVDGERCTMGPGDLVLTPRWAWHHHGNEGDEPVAWLDGLDIPLVLLLNANFFQPSPTGLEPETEPVDGSLQRYGGTLRPVWTRPGAAPRRLLTYRWETTYTALQRLARIDEASPYDDVALEYTNPQTGGHVLPTLGCWIQLLRPGVHTRAHRHTSSAVYHVFRGQGYSVIDGQRLDWAQGDFLALPGWAWHEYANPSGEEAILFSITDLPALEALDLYYEEVMSDE